MRFVFTPSPGTLFRIEGHLPPNTDCPAKPPPVLRAKYPGRLEFIPMRDGTISVIERVAFPAYLEGLAEVPPSWPDAALRAQAIAARSYAINYMRHRPSDARKLGFDICATDQCQVYRGASIALGAFGDRWVRAVRATAGQVLTYDDRVIPAYYFSTSDGRTRRSFPGGTPQPWLPSVTGEDDDAPLAHWVQRIPRARYDAVLRAAGLSPGAKLSKTAFRNTFNFRAPCLYPKEFPGKLPQTIPSESHTAVWRGDTLIVTGRGWGHYVGMSQWGAKSLAGRGRSAPSILKHYYGPAELEQITEPGVIRVLAISGMQRILVSADGSFTAATSTGGRLAPGARFEIRGGDHLTVLRSNGPSLTPVLSITAGIDRVDTQPDEQISIPFELSSQAIVKAIVDGTVAGTEQPFERGAQTFPLGVLPSGEHRVVLQARDALDTVGSGPVTVAVAAPAPSPSPAPLAKGKNDWKWWALAGGVLAAIGALFAVRGVIRR